MGARVEQRRTIGRLVRARREELGLSQERLADLTGISQTYISRIERGDVAFPTDETLAKLGDALGLTRAEFYREAGGEAGEGRRPFYQRDDARAAYTPGEVAAIVAYVEARPGEAYRARLAAQRARLPREKYEQICVKYFRQTGWTLDVVLDAAESAMEDDARTGRGHRQ